MEDPVERNFEYSGIFENDYQDGCRMHGILPFHLSRIGKQKDISRVASSLKFPVIKKYDSKNLSQADLISARSNDYVFTRKINIFVDDDDETFGLQIRGWQIPLQMIEILANSVAVSATISQLW